jgi:hypothetical protein
MRLHSLGAFGNSALNDLSGFFLKLVNYRQKKSFQIAQSAVAERNLCCHWPLAGRLVSSTASHLWGEEIENETK